MSIVHSQLMAVNELSEKHDIKKPFSSIEFIPLRYLSMDLRIDDLMIIINFSMKDIAVHEPSHWPRVDFLRNVILSSHRPKQSFARNTKKKKSR